MYSSAQIAALPREVRNRVKVEVLICRKLVHALLKDGYVVSVCDGESFPVKRSNDFHAICKAMMSTDEDTLFVRKPDDHSAHAKTVSLVYGNYGYDVIADYNIWLEGTLAAVNEYAEKFDI